MVEHQEEQYLNFIKLILAKGVEKNDRTGTGTLSMFGMTMSYDLREFPLFTTKKVFWRGVVEELLWFISGSTNAKILHDKGVKIWDANAPENWDLGPVYGFQWRHFGAKYEGMDKDYTGQGIDQLAEVIDKIKNNPDDRRIILSAWNPSDIGKMALPPCHMTCQFYIHNDTLYSQMYQRSADMGLGVPFNVASYSLLTCMIAHVCGLKPGRFIHVLGDAHIYKNHVTQLKEQVERKPRPLPTLKFKRPIDSIDDFKFEDFVLENYDPHETIKMEMSV